MTGSNADPPEIAHFGHRLDLACEKYERFGEVWARYLERRPHRMEMDTGKGGFTRVRVVRQEPIPEELSLVLGEFLYHLRAALDNCLYAVAVIDSGQRPPPNADKLEWPICLSADAWSRQARRYNALSARIRDALEGIQPYRAECPEWNCLRILHDLARVDRHRAMHFVTLYTSYGNATVDLNRIADFEVRLGEADDEVVIASFRRLSDEPLDPEWFDFNVELDVDVAGVIESPHPTTGVVQRPWGSLSQRMRALHRAVLEYTHGLVQIAKDQHQ